MTGLRVAIVGSGGQGSLIAAGIAAAGRHTVAGVCDVDSGRAETLAERVGTRPFTDHRDLLDVTRPDVTIIASMPADHRRACLDALEAGCHVLCEKPLALNADEAREVTEAASAAERTLSVNFNMRFLDQAQRLKIAVATHDLGRPVAARAWCRGPDIPWWGPHFQRERSGGGVVASSAVHLLDLALWLSDYPEVTEVSATASTLYPRRRASSAPSGVKTEQYDVEDTFQAFLRSNTGFSLLLDGTWTSSSPDIDYSLEITYERGDLTLEPLTIAVDTGTGYQSEVADQSKVLDLRGAVHRSVDDFLARVVDGSYPSVSLDQALTVQRLTDAIYESSRRAAAIPMTATSIETGQPC